MHADVGDVVLKGQKILTLVASENHSVVAYLAPAQLNDFQPGCRIKVIRHQAESQIIVCTVTEIGRVITEVAERLRKNPEISEWGIPILIDLPGVSHLLPGELVAIHQL